MEQRRKWTSLGWERSLLLVGALGVGVFMAANSCDSTKTAAIAPGGTISGAAGAVGTK